MSEETMPSPPPSLPVVEQTLHGVLSAMTEAVGALLASSDPGRFGRASRLCVMGQKISVELVTSVRDAKRLRAQEQGPLYGIGQVALAGGLGAEGQYIAQGGGDIEGYAEDQQDYAIAQGFQFPAIGPRPNDMATLQRDLLTMVQGWFEEQKKNKPKNVDENLLGARIRRYDELNELLSARKALQDPKDAPLLARIEKEIDRCIDQIGKAEHHEASSPDTHVVPAELLRGHPLGTGEQWGDAGRDRGPVLHREGGDEGAPGGGEADGDRQDAVG